MASNKNNKTWSSLTLGQWQLLQELTHLEGWDLMRSVVAVIDGGYEKVDQYSLSDLRNRYEVIAKELNEEPYKPFKNFVQIKGKKYWITRFFEDICGAQFIEISEWTSDDKKTNENLHNIVASLMIETSLFGLKAKKYNGKDHTKRATLVKENLLAVDALGLSAFFLGNWLVLLENLENFLTPELREEINHLMLERDLEKNTSG